MGHAEKVKKDSSYALRDALHEIANAIEFQLLFGFEPDEQPTRITLPTHGNKAETVAYALTQLCKEFKLSPNVTIPCSKNNVIQGHINAVKTDEVTLRFIAPHGPKPQDPRDAFDQWSFELRNIADDPIKLATAEKLMNTLDQKIALDRFMSKPEHENIFSGFQHEDGPKLSFEKKLSFLKKWAENALHRANATPKEKESARDALHIENSRTLRESLNKAINKNKLPQPLLSNMLGLFADSALANTAQTDFTAEVSTDGKRQSDSLATAFTFLADIMSETSGYRRVGKELSFESIGTHQSPKLHIRTQQTNIADALESVMKALNDEKIISRLNGAQEMQTISAALARNYMSTMMKAPDPINVSSGRSTL